MDFSPHEKLQIFAIALENIGIPPENQEDIRRLANLWNIEEDTACYKSMDNRIERLIRLVKELAPRYGGDCNTVILDTIRTEIQNQIKEKKGNFAEEYFKMKNKSIH